MYLPLQYVQWMDVNHSDNIIAKTAREMLNSNDESMLFIWYDSDFMNPEYNGKYKYVNDALFKHRKQMYKAMTGCEKIPEDPEEDRSLAMELFACFLMPNKWARDKQVYRFHEELELSLADTEEIKLPVRLLDRLPYRTFFIEFAEEGIFRGNFFGAFINIVPEKQGYVIYIERIKEDGRVMFGSVALVPDEADGTFYFNKSNVPYENGIERNRDWQEFGFFLLNALLYLCADNAEIQESEVTKRTYRKSNSIKNKFSEIRQWECGYRYGASIHSQKRNRTSAKAADKSETVPGTEEESRRKRTIIAHTRRAHWHHYWVGPRDGERKLILHWIPPTYVSGQNVAVAVVHKVS